MYLVTARYGDDAERKRIEYVLEKWRDRLNITKPEGIIVFLDGRESDELIEEFAEDLYSRTSRQNVALYRVEEARLQIEETRKEIRLTLKEKRETIGKLIAFLMAKQKAILRPSSAGDLLQAYEVSTKKGKAEIFVSIREVSVESVELRVNIRGYGEVVDFLHRRLQDELNYLQQ